MPDPILWTIPQAAEALAVSVRTVHRLNASGEIPVVRVGRCIRLRPEDVRAYVTRRAGQALPEEETQCQNAQPETRTASTSARTPRPGGARTPSEAERLAARLGF